MPKVMAARTTPRPSRPTELDTIDYSLTTHVELFSITQLSRNVRYRTWYTATWQEAVRYAMMRGMRQPKTVYSWRNLRYVEVEENNGE